MTNARNDTLLNEALSKCEWLVDKNYLKAIHSLNFCSVPSAADSISLLKIEILEEPIAPEFFTFVLNALGNLDEVFGYILHSYKRTLTLYVGLKTTGSMCTAVDILKKGLRSSYPHSKFRELSPKESARVLMELFDPTCYGSLSSAIVIPNNTTPSNSPINQKLMDLMGDEDFLAFFLASPHSRSEIRCLINELKDLYTTLSSFSETDYSFSHSTAKNTAVHITKSITESSGTTCTETRGTEHAHSTSHYTLITPAAVIPLQNSRTFSISISFNQTEGIANINNQFIAEAETKGCLDSNTKLHITSNTDTKGDSLSYVTQNKHVTDLLTKLDDLIARLTVASSEPLFYFGAYFLCASSAGSIRAAFTYSGLAKDKILNVEDAFITNWEGSESIFTQLIEELRNFNHLSFAAGPKNECIITATSITASELLNSFYFPYSKNSYSGKAEMD